MKKIIILLLSIPVAIYLRGLAIVCLYDWFILDTFSAPELSVISAIGISVIVGYLTDQDVVKKEKEWNERVISMILTPLFVISFGWILSLFA